ncbi:MAG: hypothetical protein ACU83V_02250 [Gammaproteobacteria bacterium]
MLKKTAPIAVMTNLPFKGFLKIEEIQRRLLCLTAMTAHKKRYTG